VRDEDDAAAHGGSGRGLQCCETVERDDLAFEPGRRGRRGIAEGGQHDALREGGQDLALLLAADPDGHVELLDAHVREAETAQLAHRPVPGACFCVGAGQARADFSREPFQDIVGDVVPQRRFAQPLDRHLPVLLGRG
jgi:hypothetical protein